MFRSNLSRNVLARLVPAVAGACVSVAVVTAVAQGPERSGQKAQGNQPQGGAQGREGSGQRPQGNLPQGGAQGREGSGQRSPGNESRDGAQRQGQEQGFQGDRRGAASSGPTTVHNHYYYGQGAYPAAGGSYGGGYGAQGADLSGFTNPAAAQGQRNLDNSQAIGNLTQARNQSIENHDYAVSSYYNNKKIHDQYMAEQDAEHKDDANRTEYFDRNIEPGRLSAVQFDRATGVINWPPLLRDKQFSDSRLKLDQLYHARTPSNSGVDSDNYVNITQACDAMKDVLKGMITDVPPESYIAASHFIKSVCYEGQFAAK